MNLIIAHNYVYLLVEAFSPTLCFDDAEGESSSKFRQGKSSNGITKPN